MKYSPSLSALAPEAQFRSSVGVIVHAPPEKALAAVSSVTLNDMPLARWLGNIRYLPGRLLAKLPPPMQVDLPFVRQLEQGGTMVLKRTPDEMVTASAGRLHRIVDQDFVTFSSRKDFQAFRDPDYEKLFMSVRAEPAGPGKSRLILEHWTWAMGPKAQKKFRRYWRIIRPAGNFVSRRLLVAAKRRAEA